MSDPALRCIAELPSPPGWPVLGHLTKVRRHRIHRDVEGWARDFGPVFRLRFGRRPMLVVADHELVAGLLRDRPDGWRRVPYTAQIGAEMGLPQGLFSSEGDDWRRQRRMVMAAFSPPQVRAYFASLRRVARRLRGRWAAAAAAGRDIPLQADLMRFTVDAISGLAFGRDINTLEGGDDIIQRHLDRVLPAIFRRVLSAPRAGLRPARPPWWSSKVAEPHLLESIPGPLVAPDVRCRNTSGYQNIKDLATLFLVSAARAGLRPARPPRESSKAAMPHLLETLPAGAGLVQGQAATTCATAAVSLRP